MGFENSFLNDSSVFWKYWGAAGAQFALAVLDTKMIEKFTENDSEKCYINIAF